MSAADFMEKAGGAGAFKSGDYDSTPQNQAPLFEAPKEMSPVVESEAELNSVEPPRLNPWIEHFLLKLTTKQKFRTLIEFWNVS